MTDIELKSIQTQYNLCKEIIEIRRHLEYIVSSKANMVLSHTIEVAKWPQDVAEKDLIVSIPKKDYDHIIDFLRNVHNKNYGKLESYAKDYVSSLIIQEEILKQLK